MTRIGPVLLLVTGCLSAPGDGAEGEDPDDALNLVPNGDFEVGIAGWSADPADIGIDPEAHSGDAAAFVCLNDGADLPGFYLFFTEAPVMVEAGPHRAVAWVRRLPGSSGQLVSLVVADGEGFVASSPVVATDTWQRLELDDYEASAPFLTVTVRATPEALGDCILVDDVSMARK